MSSARTNPYPCLTVIHKHRSHCLGIVVHLLASLVTAAAQAGSTLPVGEFTSQTGVGNPRVEGTAVYAPETQRYIVSGAGKNMWFGEDECHFVWKRIKGDFIVRTRAHFPEKGGDAHRKLGWMARSTLEAGSPHVNAVVHGDGLTSLQFRRDPDADTGELKSTLSGADVIQLERRGNRYIMSVAQFGKPFVTTELEVLELGLELYVGLFVCSHNPEVMEKAVFEDVRITIVSHP